MRLDRQVADAWPLRQRPAGDRRACIRMGVESFACEPHDTARARSRPSSETGDARP